MFSFGIANNCKFFVSVLAIVYVLAVSSNTEDSITLKIAEDAGPTSIPFPENLCEDLKYAQISPLFPNTGGNLSYSAEMCELVFDPGTAYQSLAKGEIDTAIFKVVLTDGTSDHSEYDDEHMNGVRLNVLHARIEIEGINSPPVHVDDSGLASCTSSVMVGERGSCSASFSDVDHSDFTPGSHYSSQLELRGVPLERCVTFARQFPGNDIITVYCNFKTDNCGDIGLLEGLEVTLDDGKGGKAFAPANPVCIKAPIPAPVPLVSHNEFTITLNGTTGTSQLSDDAIKLIGSQSTTTSPYYPLVDIITVTPRLFSCDDLGPEGVAATLTAFVDGQMASKNFTIVVSDVTPPTLETKKSIKLPLPLSGPLILDPTVLFNAEGSFDACGIDLNSLIVEPNQFTCDTLGSNKVQLSAKDYSGNAAVTTVRVEIFDSIAPTISAFDKVDPIHLDDSGWARVDPLQLVHTFDNCGISSITSFPSEFNCEDLGLREVTVRVEDVAGNLASVAVQVEVAVSLPPSIMITDNVEPITLNSSGVAVLDIGQFLDSVTDACGNPLYTNAQQQQLTFTCKDVGIHEINVTAQDKSVNVAHVVLANVTIIDSTPPFIEAIHDLDLSLNALGFAELDDPYSVIESLDDACGISSVTVEPHAFNCSNVGRNEVWITARDASGNVATAITHVKITDETAPVLVANDVDNNGFCFQPDSNGLAYVDAGVLLNDDETFDSCGIDLESVSVEPKWLGCDDVGYREVEIRAQDASGNEAKVVTSVFVEPMRHKLSNGDEETIYLPTNGIRRKTIATLPLPPLHNCQLVSVASSQDGLLWHNLGNPIEMGLVIMPTSKKKRGEPVLHSIGISSWHSKRRAAALNDAVCTPMRLVSKLMVTVISPDFQGERCFMFENVLCPPPNTGNLDNNNSQQRVTAVVPRIKATSRNMGFLGCADGEEFILLADD